MSNLKIYQSNGADQLFIQKEAAELATDATCTTVDIKVDASKTYQTMDGFGGSFTDSAAYLINQILDEDVKDELMKKLFDHEAGIGISVVRNPMGASDFARTVYSYNELPAGETDYEQEKFSIAHDLEDVIPLSQQALSINPDVKFMASPWSAPNWMKTTHSMIAGQLKEECYGAFAKYFVKYIEAYGENGLPIYAVTPQNEPLYEPTHYPSMLMHAYEQAEFIKKHLKPAFVEKDIQTKILCYDHNWDRPDYPLHVIDEDVDAIDGVAWHWYGGKPVAQTQVLMAYPDKEVHFTEGSGGEWVPAFEPAFSNLLRTGIEILRNNSQSFVLWNMALDEENGPTVPGFGRSTCRGIVQINQKTKELSYTLDYYGLAHFSKFIKPKAIRIDSTSDTEVRTVAFKNPDDTIAIVVLNDSEQDQNIRILLADTEVIHHYAPSKSAMTIVYDDSH